MDGRSDLDKYKHAVKTMENCFCFKHGGATRRAGTRFVAEVKDSTKLTRLIRFEFSTEQSYIIELGNLYARFYADSGRIENPPGTAVEIATPYLEAELAAITFTQSFDTMYLAHGNHPAQKLTRTSDILWTITPIPFTGGPFFDESSAITITASAVSGAGVTLLASAPLFNAGHVGTIWRIKGVAVWGYVRITAVTDSLNATCDVIVNLDGVGPSVAQAEGSWSAYRGYPKTTTLFQQRLLFGGTEEKPATFWGSHTSDYENFDEGTAQENEACTFTLASNKVNAIRWMVPSRALLIGTTGGEWSVTGGGTDTPITPANIDAKAETTHGSAITAPVQADGVVLFLQKAGRKIREFTFDFNSDAYQAPDVSVLAEHVTEGGIIDMDYQQELDSIVWMTRSDGVLVGMTYDRAQEVVGFHRHITGTAQDASDGKFESVAVIPHPDGDRDQVWMVVNRTIGGVTKRYVEQMETKEGYYDSFNVDSGVIYEGAATSTISGLSHLEGETVSIVGNGAVLPQKVVAGGQVTGLTPTVTQAEVGLHFPSKIVTMRPEGGSDSGTAMGAHKRFNQLFVRLFKTIGCKVAGDQLQFRSASDPMDTAVPLFTGDKTTSHMGFDRDGQIEVRQDQPLPFTLLAIIGVLSVND